MPCISLGAALAQPADGPAQKSAEDSPFFWRNGQSGGARAEQSPFFWRNGEATAPQARPEADGGPKPLSPSGSAPPPPPQDVYSSPPSSLAAPSSSGPIGTGRPVSILPALPDPRTAGDGVADPSESTLGGAGRAPDVLFPSGPTAPGSGSAGGVRTVAPRPGSAEQGIEVGTLVSVDESSAGLLRDREGGLGTDMWDGTRRLSVEQYLPGLPVTAASPAMRDLTRRLLLTPARPPYGATEGMSLLGTRLERLHAMGDAEAVRDLVDAAGAAGAAMRDPAVAMAYARASMAVGEVGDACNALRDLPVGGDPARDPDAAFNLKLSAVCQLVGDEKIAASLTADLAREQGLDDPLFQSLVAEAASGIELKAPAPAALDGLTLALYALAGRPLPDNAPAIAERALLPFFATADVLAPVDRVEAAERAAAAGLILGEQLSAAYLGLSFTAEEETGVATGDLPEPAPLRHALLHRAILDDQPPEARAELLGRAFAVSETDGFYLPTVAANRPALLVLPPTPALGAFSPDAVRAFLSLGDGRRAAMWYAVVAAGAAGAAGSAGDQPRAGRELGALLRMAGIEPLPSGEVAAAEIIADFKSGDPSAAEFAALEAAMFDALGIQLPSLVWEEMLDARAPARGEVPEPQITRALIAAAQNGRRGETVMLALTALGDGGPAAMHPRALSDIVSSLRAVGLEAEARGVALEALMARTQVGLG